MSSGNQFHCACLRISGNRRTPKSHPIFVCSLIQFSFRLTQQRNGWNEWNEQWQPKINKEIKKTRWNNLIWNCCKSANPFPTHWSRFESSSSSSDKRRTLKLHSYLVMGGCWYREKDWVVTGYFEAKKSWMKWRLLMLLLPLLLLLFLLAASSLTSVRI